jgi:hypothetical protein
MHNRTKAATLAAVVILAVAGATVLHAQDRGSSGSMMRPGMMNRDGMMGRGMMDMMGMMQRMGPMMDHCADMMESGGDHGRRPNDQWRKSAPTAPGQGD